MAPVYNGFAFFLLAAAASAPAAAQDITVWSAVAFVMYGERTPLVGPTIPELTPLGAQEMYVQGATLRSRYVLDGSGNTSTSAALPIYGIEPNALDTTQVTALSTDDSYVAAGALAFLQGLYPPQTDDFAYDNGGRGAAVLANGALVDFPLDGYQYPLVTTASLQDPTSSWLEGNVACTEYQVSAINFRDDVNVASVYNNTLYFYQQLWPTIFQGVFSEAMTNFYYAYELYDYASYQYNHNPQIANTLNASELDILRVLASTQQLDLNANLSVSGTEEGDMIRAISGRMLAQQVVTMLRQNMVSSGANNKLSLMFGSFEPFLSFFALSGLLSSPNAGDFESLPGNGGVMVFELYSLASTASSSGDTTIYPSPDELYVRFLYRADTDVVTPLAQYGLFTNSTTELNMTYTAFASAMGAIGVDSVTTWCQMCDGVSIFCPGLLENAGYGDGSGSGSSSGGNKNSGLAPAVAGVIGALVTLAVVGLVILAAMLLGGMRFYFAGRGARRNSDGGVGSSQVKRFSFSSAAGGFKGSERKATDTDVAVSKAGACHERVGSWELRNKGSNAAADAEASSDAGSAGVNSFSSNNNNNNVRAERVRSTILNRAPEDDDDDIMADLGRGRVDPREHV